MYLKDYGQLVEFDTEEYCDDCDALFEVTAVEDDGERSWKCPGCDSDMSRQVWR